MKVSSSNIQLESSHHQQVDHQAQLDVSLEREGDTIKLSQSWELSAEEASTQRVSQELSGEAQQKSLALLGKLRRLSDAQAGRASDSPNAPASPLTAATGEQAATRRPHPQDPLRASINPAGKLNRGRRPDQVPALTDDEIKDAKLYAFSLLVSKLTQKSVYISELSTKQMGDQGGERELISCAQGASECEGRVVDTGGLLRSFYEIEFGVESSAQGESVVTSTQTAAPTTRNLFNGFSRLEGSGEVSAQRLRIDIGEISGESFAQGETVEVRYTEERVETECLNVSGCGRVVLEDGREITFDLDVSLQRASVQKLEVEISNRALKDPLIIDFGPEAAEFTDQRFEFDLDADGEMDSMPALDSNGGILVIDHDQDGVVDDGSEVVGALSSDAFGDLRALDDDQNGWIDEGDQIYDQLRVWTFNAEGEQSLLNLNEADVGAIYLGAVEAEFSHHDDRDQLIAQQRLYSVYLKSSGEVGSARQVDVVA